MAAITGTDELSLKIIDCFRSGARLKDIPGMFPVSLDQAKRLSRYFNYLQEAAEHLSKTEVEKIHKIGLKSLQLASLFKEKDWEGLTEVLSVVNENTKRDEIPLLIQALQEKRQRIRDFERDIETQLDALEQREKELFTLTEKIKETQAKIEEEVSFLSKYPENVQAFLVRHLGLYEGKLVLARRLDSRWQKALKKSRILVYNSQKYVWFVEDLDGLVGDYMKRTNRKQPMGTEWIYEKEIKRSGGYVNNPNYSLPDGLATDLRSSIEEAQQQVQEIDSERKRIQREMKELRRTSPQSFIESIQASNTIIRT